MIDDYTGWRAWLRPLKALCSIRFYFVVLFHLHGWGFVYLTLLSLAIAVPGTYQVQRSLRYYADLELPDLVSRIPPSNVDGAFVLRPAPEAEEYKELFASNGQLVFVYNPLNKPLSGQAQSAFIEIGPRALILRHGTEQTEVPYTAFLVANTSFDPLSSAIALDRILKIQYVPLLVLVFCWFVSLLMFNALLSSLFAKFLLLFISGIRIGYGNVLRICSYASTMVALILLLQCFVLIPLSFTALLLIPLIYTGLFARAFKQELMTLGLEGFGEKYGFRLYEGGREADSRQQEIDRLTGRVSAFSQAQSVEQEQENRQSVEDPSGLNDEQVQNNGSKSELNSAAFEQSRHNSENKDSRKDGQRGSGYFTP